ncbi:MAG TPA: DUF3788 domain-containing protein [Prolixibacteraceae bacterium]|nr:DUF3788 domain-containing protein [Prolixibacteraceae bacterium]
MDTSIFTDKNIVPTDVNLSESLGLCYDLWQNIKEYVLLKYPKATAEWNYPGVKYGWSFRIKDKKRAIIYFLPREKYFKVAFVFGQKATDAVMASDVSEAIKSELNAARAYAEGRGITVEVKNSLVVNDIKELVDIKIAH